MEEPKPADQNGLAIASLILGILSLVAFGILTGIPAIITGIMGMKNPVNKGMSVAGLVMGIVSTVITVLVVAFFVFLFFIAGSSSGPNAPSNKNDPGASSSIQRT